MRRMRTTAALLLCMQLLCGLVLPDIMAAQGNPFALTALAKQPEGESLADNAQGQTEQQLVQIAKPAETETILMTPTPEEMMMPVTETETGAEQPEVTPMKAPADTEAPVETERPKDTKEPGQEERETDAAKEEPHVCDVLPGRYGHQSAAPGERITLAIPIAYIGGGRTYQSNADENGEILPYSAENTKEDYNQEIGTVLAEAKLAIKAARSSRFPLDPGSLSQEERIVDNGVNRGYAVFGGARIREDAAPGTYPVRLLATWTDQEGQEHTKTLTIRIKVTAPDKDEESEADAETEDSESILGLAGEADLELEGDQPEDEIPEPGVVSLGEYEVPSAEEGGAVTLAVAIRYARGAEVYLTNQGPQGNLLDYEDSLPPGAYDQSLAEELVELTVRIADGQGQNSPLAPGAHGLEQRIIAGGENHGFASFENIPIAEETAPGTYPVQLHVSWLEADGAEWQTATLTAMVSVLVSESAEQPMAETSDSMALGACDPFTAIPGDTHITLAIPLAYTTTRSVYDEETDSFEAVETRYDTNADTNADGEEKHIVPYNAGNTPGSYDQTAITAQLTDVTIEIMDGQSANCPLDLAAAQVPRALIADGENKGYAVFENVPLVAGLSAGTYPLELRISWQNAAGEARTEEITIYVNVSNGGPLLYGQNGIIVFTHAQLKSALQGTVPGYSGHNFDPIYLGYCGTDMPAQSWETRNNGVIQYPASSTEARIPVARSVTIIGTDPRNSTRIKVIDRAIIYSDTPVYSSSGIYTNRADITITVRDVQWEGHNQNGIVMGYYRSGAEFINVDYTGSRMFASDISNSWVIINNCRIHITDLHSGQSERGQEVAKTGDIRLYGRNTISRDGYVSGIWYAVFWVNVAPYKVTVYPGAKVTVDSNNYFLRESVPASSVLDVQGMLDVTTRNSNGGMTYALEYIDDLRVSGSLKVKHYGTGYDCLRAQTLVVSGSLDIELVTGSTTDSCLAIFLGSATFHSPKFVSLKNPGGLVIEGADGHVDRALKITTRVINRWPLSDASMTKYIWNNNDLSSFTVNAEIDARNTAAASATGLTGGTGVSLKSSAVNPTTFRLNNTTRLEFGEYFASIDQQTVHYGSGEISGSAPKGSMQTVEEYLCPGGVLGSRIQSVATTGDTSYRTGGDWNPIATADSRVYVLSKKGDLEAHIYADCAEVLALHYVPAAIDFGTVAISGDSQQVRPTEDWKVQVMDTRVMGSWTLSVAAAPLTSEDGLDTLPEALVFIQPDGEKQPLSSDALVVASRQPGDMLGIKDLTWDEDKGFRLELNPYDGTPGMGYTTTLVWTLQDV